MTSSAPRTEADRGPLLGALLRSAYQALASEMTRGLSEAGYPDYNQSYNIVLRPLWDHEAGVRSTELAATARITKQSVGTIIDQLEAQGYVERVDDPGDRRAKLIRLTRRGRDAGRTIRAVVRRVEVDWAKRIGAARLSALRATLTELLTSLEMSA